jgi:hypothetical protein
MTATLHCRLPLVAAALLLLLAAPAGARAACGDYLHVGDDHQPANPAQPAPKPCHGPNCSQRQLPELPLAPVPTTTFSDDFCWVAISTSAEAQPRSAWPHTADVHIVIHTPADIFHPPR